MQAMVLSVADLGTGAVPSAQISVAA